MKIKTEVSVSCYCRIQAIGKYLVGWSLEHAYVRLLIANTLLKDYIIYVVVVFFFSDDLKKMVPD